jgi:Pectate lyase superfamily protein
MAKLAVLAALAVTVLSLTIAATAQTATRVNVKNYGARGDNVADDTAAIGRALYAGKTRDLPVYFPAGRYRVSTLVLPSGVTLQGAGGTTDARTDSRFEGTWLRGRVRFASGDVIRDMKIGDATGTQVTPASKTVSNVTFTRVRFRGGNPAGGGGAIFVIGTSHSVRNLRLRACRIERNLGSWSPSGAAGGFDVTINTSNPAVVEGIWIENCVFGVTNGVKTGQPTFNIVFWQEDEPGVGYWDDVHILYSTFLTTDEFNLDFDGNELSTARNSVEIKGCVIRGGGIMRGSTTPSWGYGICLEPTYGSVISGNRLWKSYAAAFKTTKGASRNTFSGNVIDKRIANGVKPLYSDGSRTILLYEGRYNRVLNNTVYLPAGVTPARTVIDSRYEPTSIVSGNRVVH